MKKILNALSCVLLLSNTFLFAQSVRFTTSGIIEYTKTINMYALLKKGINKGNENVYNPAFEQYKKDHPQFIVLNSTVNFSDNKTLFTPRSSQIISAGFFGVPQIALQNNIVYMDYTIKHYVSQKIIFDDTYLIKDSIQKIHWKLTDEVRDIAGYSCRRANAIILDSVYIVAFYTDKIPVSGGPESFTGLPGMILQVTIPHENISWVATKVDDVTIPNNTIIPPNKGKNTNQKGLIIKLKELSKSGTAISSADLKAFLL
jgi:GLPGLI family protein